MGGEIMTLAEVATYLQVGRGKLYRLAHEGRIPATKIGRTWRFRKDLLDEWFKRQSSTVVMAPLADQASLLPIEHP